MIVQCPACSSRYRIREANIPPSGGKIRCPQCGHSFVVYPESPQDDLAQDEDRTSITSQNALNQLVSGMASSNRNAAMEERTEQIDKDEVNRIRALQAMATEVGTIEDGTVEVQNPMKIWQQAQDAMNRQAGLGGDESSAAEDDYDAAPTEVVSGVGFGTLPFPSKTAKIPARESAPAFNERIEMPASKPAPPPLNPGPPSLPKPPALPRGAGSGQFPSASGAGQQAKPGSGDYDQPGSGPRFPISGAPQNPGYGQPASPPRSYGAEPWDGGSADASRDILSAIDEVTGPEEVAPAEPDLQHAGPWKLKTNFGLTYEFPDNKSLRSWLSSRDELDGYTLSADGENFFGVHVFSQLKSRPSLAGQIPSTGMSHLGIQQPGGLGSLPASGASGQFPTAGGSGPYAAQGSGHFSTQGSGQYPSMASGQYPTAGGSGGFTPPAQISQTMQQQAVGQGLPQNEVIQNTYRPPSRDAGQSKVLWAIFVLLIAICVGLALHTFDVINLFKLVGLEEETVSAPVGEVVEPVGSIESVIDYDADAEIENLLKEARRDVRNKKLQSALERLRTIETLDPKRIEVFELRAEAYESLGQPEEAEAARQRAADLRTALSESDAPDGEDPPAEDEALDPNP